MRVRIVDLDGSVMRQPTLLAHMPSGGDVIAAGSLAPRLRLLADRSALGELAEHLGAHREGDLHFIGSGDFHHLTLLLAERVGGPLSIVHFDNHPDWVRFPGSLNCGSWVARALENPLVLRVVTIGPDSPDLATPQLSGAALQSLRTGRLEVHPFAAGATFYAGPAFNGHGMSAPRGSGRRGLTWPGIAGPAWLDTVEAIAARLPDAPVWITVDKDVLVQEEAVTNWDQGRLSLFPVLDAVTVFARQRRIAGMDVCGDFSLPADLGPWRRLLAFSDRAQRPSPPNPGSEINGAANMRILRHMEALLS